MQAISMATLSSQTRCLILILNYRGAEDTISCIEGLLSDPDIGEESIVVVDNGSLDGSIETIETRFPWVRILKNQANLGYAEGFNCALRQFMASDSFGFFFLLNNDVIVRKNTFRKLLQDLEGDGRIGIIGPAVLDPDTDRVQSLGASIDWYRCRSVLRFSGRSYGEVPHKVQKVDYVSGCAMLITRNALETAGLFPGHFFMYGEEEDLCIRVAKVGLSVICDSGVAVEHRVGSTSNRFTGLKEYYLTRNRFLVMKRHATICQFAFFLLWLTVIEFPFTSIRNAIEQGTCKSVLCKLKGIATGLVQAIPERRIQCNRLEYEMLQNESRKSGGS